MKTLLTFLVIVSSAAAADQIPNRLIDYAEFKKIVFDSVRERETHRLTEKQFVQAMADKDTVVLDARSASRYALRHVRAQLIYHLPISQRILWLKLFHRRR